jgi:hypothetical protein
VKPHTKNNFLRMNNLIIGTAFFILLLSCTKTETASVFFVVDNQCWNTLTNVTIVSSIDNKVIFSEDMVPLEKTRKFPIQYSYQSGGVDLSGDYNSSAPANSVSITIFNGHRDEKISTEVRYRSSGQWGYLRDFYIHISYGVAGEYSATIDTY